MAKTWRSRPIPRPTSITEIARRYHAAAVALAQTLGLSLAEVLTQHRESVTAIFIECGRCDLRLPAGVPLPHVADAPVRVPTAQPSNGRDHAGPVTDVVTIVTAPNGDTSSPTVVPTDSGLPTSIPAGLQLPCAEALIADLRPPQLSLLIGKVGLRALADKSLEPLHVALLAERARRFEQGRKPTPVPEVAADVP
jgi:hypothetical protein